MSVQPIQRTVFHAPTRGRSYFTVRAAAKAEAGALLVKKYPTEKEDTDWRTGQPISAGWHWSSDERLVRVHARLAKLLQRRAFSIGRSSDRGNGE